MQKWAQDEADDHATDLVLAALADPVRRAILSELDTWLGNTIAYMQKTIPLTRQGIHKHLKFMIKAGIVIKSCLGRTSLYYMDPRPIRRAFATLGRRYKRDLRPLGNLYTFGSPYSPFD